MRPGRGVITQTRLDSCTASSIEWVTKTTVGRLVIQSVCRSVRMLSRVIASSLPSGSSRSSVSGSCTIAWQKAARCCMPPESSQGWRSLEADEPHRVEQARRCAPGMLGDIEAAQLELQGDVAPDGPPRHQRVVLEHDADVGAAGRVTSSPSTSTSPLVGSSSPAMISIRVDLPQPDGPSSETNSPAPIWRSAGPKAWTASGPPPKILVRPAKLDRSRSCRAARLPLPMEGLPRRGSRGDGAGLRPQSLPASQGTKSLV